MMIAAAVLFTGAFAEAQPAYNARFEHADSTVRSVTMGATGKVSINITMTRSDEPAKSTLLHAISMKGEKGLSFQSRSDMGKMNGKLPFPIQFKSALLHATSMKGMKGKKGLPFQRRSDMGKMKGKLPFPIRFPKSDITSYPEITKDGSSWKLSFGQDAENKTVELVIKVNSNDCKAATETTTAAVAEEFSTESTTVEPEEATDSTETTSSDWRRLEAIETTPAPETEIPDETEETEETEEEESSSCDDGLTCDLALKSCQIAKEILPAGSAGTQGYNSSAVQNSSCAILAAMVAYLMI